MNLSKNKTLSIFKIKHLNNLLNGSHQKKKFKRKVINIRVKNVFNNV